MTVTESMKFLRNQKTLASRDTQLVPRVYRRGADPVLLWEAWIRNSGIRLKKSAQCTEGLPMVHLGSAEMKFSQWVGHCILARSRICREPERVSTAQRKVEVEMRKSGHQKKKIM